MYVLSYIPPLIAEQKSIFAYSVSTHILASHSAAGHLEVVLSVVLGVKRVLGAGMEQRSDRFLVLKHQINIA